MFTHTLKMTSSVSLELY